MAKLSEEQRKNFATNLGSIFCNLTTEEIDDFVNNVVPKAKREAIVEKRQNRKIFLSNLFDSQIETLKSRGCPEVILDEFQAKQDDVLSHAVEMTIPEGHIPFMPVVPCTYLGIYGLMPMVRNGDNVGFTYLNPNEIVYNIIPPKIPYFIFDVESGENIMTLQEAWKLIEEKSYSWLTPDEGIAVCIHTNVLSGHRVYCIDSRYEENDDKKLNVHLLENRPILSWDYVTNTDGQLGYACCYDRL